MKKLAVLTLFVLAAVLVIGMVGCKATPVELNISAASSLTDALSEINELYVSKNPNVTITPNFASSGTLQTQIEEGAPADVFISAAAKQMDALQEGGLIVDDTRRDLLNNKIVLVVPANSTLKHHRFYRLNQR